MTGPRPLHVFLVAGEVSGDRLGGALMQALKARAGEGIRISGVGGCQMAAEGLCSLFPLGDLAIMGFLSVPAKLRTILRRIRQTADAIIAAKPDVLVIIDSPDFTHRVARRVRAVAPDIPIVNYVSPSIWAWRPWRARSMRRYIDHVLAVLPFEPAAHARLGGPPCTFVGHPVADRIHELRPNAEEARRRESEPPILLVMPGSRSGELRHMLPVFRQTISMIFAHAGSLEVVVPTVPHLLDAVRAEVMQWPAPVRVVVDPAEKNAAFREARAALVKSGTGTLELALAGVPMVAAYKVSRFEAFVAKPLLSTTSFILANLVLGELVVPELLQTDCTPERLASALLPLLGDTPERQAQVSAFAGLDDIMEIGRASPSDRAASVVLDLVGRGSSAPISVVAPRPPAA